MWADHISVPGSGSQFRGIAPPAKCGAKFQEGTRWAPGKEPGPHRLALWRSPRRFLLWRCATEPCSTRAAAFSFSEGRGWVRSTMGGPFLGVACTACLERLTIHPLQFRTWRYLGLILSPGIGLSLAKAAAPMG